MPLFGTLDITQNAKHLPTLANLDTEAWTLPKAETMQLLIEVPSPGTARARLARSISPSCGSAAGPARIRVAFFWAPWPAPMPPPKSSVRAGVFRSSQAR